MRKGWSQRRACALVELVRDSYNPVAQRRNDEPVQQALQALSGRHPGWGFWKLHHRLRKKGWQSTLNAPCVLTGHWR